jgi:signal transduction histidine kinase
LLDFLFQRGLAPHGYCLLWNPVLLWLHIVSDAVTALSYFSIPVVLWAVLRRHKQIELGWLIGLFACFIFACGTTHLLSIAVLWIPAYGIEGMVKAVTAVVSLLTAIALWPLLPKLLAMPSPAQLQLALDQLKAEVAERELAEEMLRQSQKLKAIGQLSAGIAHDFNNLLTVIEGNIDRVLRYVGEEPNITTELQDALAATERAATVTSQMLSFARQQPLILKIGNANTVITNLISFLKKSVGTNISMRSDLAVDLPEFNFDQNQLENAIINLAINARDAMPSGGELVLSTQRDNEDNVVICVRDNGTGMDDETLNRATEPFYTTKPIGVGTGLGLSQVYGFVSQVGGRIEIKSALGVETAVRLIFPIPKESICQ